MNSVESFTSQLVSFSKSIYGNDFIPLHRPVFEGNEKNYLIDCIDSNFVSSVGKKVTEFESKIAEFTGSKYAIATVNGTAALHTAIQLAGVKTGDEVLTQAVTFIATCNALSYAGAEPIFIDVDKDTMGMSPNSLKIFLESNAKIVNGETINKKTGKKIAACVPMHTFGIPCRIKDIQLICDEWNLSLIEDCAESLGSYTNKIHTGKFGQTAILSFNGNKLITTGGGGMIITDDENIAIHAKHITTTSKVPHPFEFVHDEVGYNYRMPNLNAALGCAQMERLEDFLIIKTNVAEQWNDFLINSNAKFIKPLDGDIANNWLNTIRLNSKSERDYFLDYTNKNGVMTRPIWTLMSKLPMFNKCQTDGLKNSIWLEGLLVNIPSSVPDGALKKLDR